MLTLLSFNSAEAVIDNPLTVGSFTDLVAAIADILLYVLTPIAVMYLIYAGFKFVLARGNPTELVDARKTLIWTLVGIVILLGAATLATILSSTLSDLGVGVLP
ncbi:hypothetical protein A2442_03410 [Candidatus Campbellbacteria bacterium RIFOXYC2_FULL_35_25]|uniref:Uncharacterized protein n=1 Tax=Candidatus Campbellbacteria bacterium RIFOXYC2_FULL_35_25 TaxID=1797582 RepID=A0A1F5EI69_9BACT|nr:MAG: hypothetical protein A2442_03410 [Candidatus Campbellbacteria bacterium RIFOXYC2_FULL_35_25]